MDRGRRILHLALEKIKKAQRNEVNQENILIPVEENTAGENQK